MALVACAAWLGGGLLPARPAAAEPEAVVARFAPLLRFDQAATTFPMSAQTYVDRVLTVKRNPGKGAGAVSNRSLAGDIPTYYQVARCGGQVRIMYWWFYAQQERCDGVSGGRDGDWERLMVTLTEDQGRVAAVTYWQQGGHYTRFAGKEAIELHAGTHPVVRVGKHGHGSYHDGSLGTGGCGYWADFRNPGKGKELPAWSRRLLPLDPAAPAEPWIAWDAACQQEDTCRLRRWGGPDASAIHPTLLGPTCQMLTCSGAAVALATDSGCWQSHCPVGYHDGIKGTCLQDCRGGYADTGLTCHRISPPHSYAPGRRNLRAPIPTGDCGLVKPCP